ncbi:MAG: hypothetical protein JWM27_4933 [Gemmatimonadetes bacterium]|nr:hypothetical protein [Gemmatimonadota bacterium]
MAYRRGDSRGFTGVELLIVVVVIGLLAGVATGTHLVMQRRAIERVVAGDLDAYAQAEMTARGDEGKFLAYDELVAAGFQGWSDDVELNQVETTRDRTYVRIRSRRTGYACALDLSPVTGSAWNRKVCRDREDDPALAIPAGIAITAPGADTASVARPPAPVPLAADHLLPPDVGDGEDVVLAPGASRVVLFPVTNRSAEARTFTFSTASADPGLAPVPGLPAPATLQAGETAGVPVSVSVAPGSLADVAAEVALTASDAGDRAYSGSGLVHVRAALALAAPEVTPPAAEVRDAGETFTVEYRVRNLTNAARVLRFQNTIPAGSALAAAGPPLDQAFGAGEERVVTATYRLDPAAEGETAWTAQLTASDRDAPGITATSDPFQATVRAVLAPPVLSAFPAATILPGETGSSTATLTSASNVTETVCFETAVLAGSAPAGSVVSPEPQPPACLRLPPHGSAQVVQAATVAPAAESPWSAEVTVRAYDAARPQLAATGRFSVVAGLVLANPGVSVPATPPLVSWTLGEVRTLDYTLANASNAARELCLDVAPSSAVLVPAAALPVCATVPARGSQVVQHALRGVGGGEASVAARVYDRLAPAYQAQASFGARVADARPVALWSTPSPSLVRHWIDFDASRSYSPSGTRIARYIWSWGLFNQQWDGTRFVAGPTGVAGDEVATPVVQRAYDFTGRFEVCLVVEDEQEQRSDPNCGGVTALAETRARLAFRYRGWWYDAGFCIDVPWSNQCQASHGNARWEILLNQSQGDIPIRRAWADVRVAFWQTDDKFQQTFDYAGNLDVPPYTFSLGGTPARYDFHSQYYNPSGPVQRGSWRVLDTNGTGGAGWPSEPDLQGHPLVLNADLGSATGIFDGGPHWSPDAAWITLHVEDAAGNVTQQSAYLDHDKSAWKGGECIDGTSGWLCTRGYERLTPPQELPIVTVNKTGQGAAYRFTGSATSPDGRLVDSWWEVTRTPLDPHAGAGWSATYRGTSYSVELNPCEEVSVTLVYVDDRGQKGRGYEDAERGTPQSCSRPGGVK